MSSNSTSKQPQPPPQHLHLHVGTASATAAATTTTNGSAASPAGSSESSFYHSPRAPRRHTLNATGPIPLACAACKYQRRKCARDCLLAPYFPADQPRRFLKAQRLFGVSNMQKTLQKAGPKHGPDAARSLIYEAEARAADPVGGCVGIIIELQRQMHNAQMELEFVRQQVAIWRQQAASATDGGGLSDPAAAMFPPAAYPEAVPGQQDDMTSAVAAICAAQQPSVLAGDLRNDPSSHQQQLYDYFCYNSGAAGDEATSDDVEAGSPAVALGEQLRQHCQIQALPFVDAFDVKPQLLLPPPATIQHHGPAAAGDVLHPGQKKLATPFLEEHDDLDEHDEDEYMEEQEATAGAPCHLELGFSSSSYNA